MPRETLKIIGRKVPKKNTELNGIVSDQNKNSYKKSHKENFDISINNLKNKYPSRNIQKTKESVAKKTKKTVVEKPIPVKIETPPQTEEEIVDTIVEPRVIKEEFNTPEPITENSEDVFGIENKPIDLKAPDQENIFGVEPTPIVKEEDNVAKKIAEVKKRLAEIEKLKAKSLKIPEPVNLEPTEKPTEYAPAVSVPPSVSEEAPAPIEKEKNEFVVGQVVKIKRSPSSGGQIEDGWIVSGFTEDGKVIVRGKTIAKEGGVNEYQQRTVTQETLINWQKLEAEIDIRETNNKEEESSEKDDVLKTIVGARHRLEDLEKAKKAALDKMEKEKKEEMVKATLEIERLSREKSALDKKIFLLNTEYQKLQKRNDSFWSKITFGIFVDEEKMMELSDEIATLESQQNTLKEAIEKTSRLLN